MRVFSTIGIALIVLLLCVNFVSCSSGDEEPIEPTPKPEIIKSEITIDSNLITNGLSFSYEKGEQSISFITNGNWTLNVAATTSGATWCTASVTSGSTGTANVKFTVTENTDYEDRSVSITIKSGTATKTFNITQKCKEALLVTTNKYEVSQEGGTIDIEVKANIEYKMEISEKAKEWIKESESRGLTTYKHTLEIAENPDAKEREGEVYFRSGDKVETVKVYQTGSEAVIMLSKNEYTVSDQGETISVDIKSNIEFGVKMPNVNWIADEASSRGLSSHTLKYIVKPNDTYDNRSAEIIFYDKNSDLKETLKIIQTQKDAIVISKKEYEVKAEGETIEVELNSNVDFELSIENDWIKQVESKSSRALVSHKLYFQISENESEKERTSKIIITDKTKNITESIIIKQKNKEDNTPYLTFQADAAQTLTLSKAVATLEYSVDGGEWNTLGTTTVTFGGKNGDLRLRGKSSTGTANSTSDYAQIEFGTDAAVTCTGDIRTLVDYGNYTTANTQNARFGHLFHGCSTLTTAPELPATTLADRCYEYMFCECTNLITTPQLPAESVPTAGYYHMFEKCSSLTKAPELPAMTVGSAGYNTMFAECTNLTNAPELPATTLEGENHYACMFMNCTSLIKTPTVLPSMVATTNCYANMFDGCVKITSAPKLPATTVSLWCYDDMFRGCVSLVNGPDELPATKLAPQCYSYMFSGCKNLKKAPKLPATELTEQCYIGMFGGCTSLETAPELPATKLVSYCYKGMFAGCNKLNTIKMYATDISAAYCLENWVQDVSPTGIFTKAKGMTSLPTGTSGIPTGWGVKNNGETTISFTLTKAGTLSTLISDENIEEISSLKITGDLNGTDIRLLRKMSGRLEDGTATTGKLTDLDLTDANIVAGGNYYIKYDDTEYNTENNIAGDYMFFQCKLKMIKFPTTVTKLGKEICSHLYISDNHRGTFTSITIPNGIEIIGDNAFAYNRNLTSIELPNTLKEIGANIFYRCDALTSVYIPNSVEKMSCAFYFAVFRSHKQPKLFRNNQT